jgi:tetratricopeptide (TPR) repeat protein
LPLALELAAAVAASLPLEVIAARLEADERFLLLRGGRRTADARQQSLEALIDWSYNLLNPSEQALFRRLAVFRGGWTLGAAEEVGGFDPIAPGDVLGLLLRLVEKSLVQVADYAQGRYRMLETLRAYGLKQLAGPEGVESRHADEAAVTRQRHVDYFVALGEQAEPALRGPEQRKWLDRLDAERDNLRAVLDGSAQAADAAAGLRLAGAIWWYWRRRGLYSEGSALLARVLEAMPPSFQGRSLAKARHAAGTLALLQGRYDAARSMLLDAVPIWKALGDNLGLGRTLSNLADISFELGDYAAAESLNLECLALKRATGDRWGEANTLGRLGYIARARGDIPIAESSLAAGLTLFRDLGDEAAVAKYVIDVAECRRLQGDVAGARRMLVEALDLSRRVQDLPNGREALIHLAHLALSTRDVDQAQRYLTELKATDHLASGPQRRGETLHLAGLLAMEAGDAVRAAQLLEESLALERTAGHRRAIGDALAGLALVGILSGRPNQAAEHLVLCLTSRQALGHWLLTMEGLEIGVLWALAQDDRNAAARLLAFTSRLRAEKGVARMPFMQHALDSASGSGGLLDQAPGTAGTPDAPPPLHTMEDAVAFAIAMASSSVAD